MVKSHESLPVEGLKMIQNLGSILGLGRSPGEGNGYPLQYSCWRIPWTEDPCQEAFNRRLPVRCFGSVGNSLLLINSLLLNTQELRGEASLSQGLKNPGISFISFSIQ